MAIKFPPTSTLSAGIESGGTRVLQEGYFQIQCLQNPQSTGNLRKGLSEAFGPISEFFPLFK